MNQSIYRGVQARFTIWTRSRNSNRNFNGNGIRIGLEILPARIRGEEGRRERRRGVWWGWWGQLGCWGAKDRGGDREREQEKQASTQERKIIYPPWERGLQPQ